MKKLTAITALIVLSVAVVGITAGTQEVRAENDNAVSTRAGDIEILHELIRESRSDLKTLQVLANSVEKKRNRGSRERGESHEGREGRGEHAEGREGRREHAEGRERGEGHEGREGREGRGESGEGGDEEGGTRMGIDATWDNTRNGAHMVIAYDASSQSFKGVVENTTQKTLEDVRVEVHLSNGTELGPTKRTDLEPGHKIDVELSAAGERFSWWTTHPESGSEEGHGPGHEGSEGEADSGNRPTDPELRPLYNELMLLRNEIKNIRKSFGLRG